MGVVRNREELMTQLKNHNEEITIVGDYANTVFSKYASSFSVDPMRNLVGGPVALPLYDLLSMFTLRERLTMYKVKSYKDRELIINIKHKKS